MNSISIVKGNEARLIVNLTRILATQTEATPLDISEVKDLRVRLIPRCGSSIDLQASAYTNNNSIMVTIPVLPCGTYSMEITGTRNLLRIASRELCVLRIVYDNSLATVPSGEIEGSKSYDIDITMVLYTERAYDIDEEVTEDGKNAPRTSAVHKALQMYGEAAQQTAEELEAMQNKVNELAEGVSDVVESEQERVKAEQGRVKAEQERVKAEQERVKAEQERKEAETKREQSFSASKQSADDAADRANDVASHQPYIGEDLYWYLYDEATKTYNKTDKYSKGDNFSIKATFESIAEMEAHVNTEALTLVVGDFVIISTDVEEEDNAKLYVVASVTDGKPTYRYIDDFSGSRGFTGHTPQISIGTITTLPAGSSASSTLTEDGVDEDGNPIYKLNLAIPMGDTFTYEDLTAENIAELQRPAKEATEAANAAAELARAKAEAAQTAAEIANTAAANADNKASLADAAAAKANEATTASQKQTESCKSATDLAEELNAHQPIIGDDGYWYYWNSDTDTYIKTDTLARGGEYLVDLTDDDCDFVMTAGTGDPADIFTEDDCNLNINA